MQPNEPYWEYVDTVVQMAWEKGIRVAMVPMWGSYVHLSGMLIFGTIEGLPCVVDVLTAQRI